MDMRRTAALAAGLVVLAISSSATAQDTRPRPAASGGDGYSYSFDDDPLQAGGLEPSFPRIPMIARADRSTLIRPRTAFVVELLKSAEAL